MTSAWRLPVALAAAILILGAGVAVAWHAAWPARTTGPVSCRLGGAGRPLRLLMPDGSWAVWARWHCDTGTGS